MTFKIKGIVAAATFMAMGAASAASVTVVTDGTTISNNLPTATGSGGLVFSKNLASALKLGSVQAGAFGGATSTPTTALDSAGKSYNTYLVTAPITSVTFDDVTHKVQQVLSVGGATQDMAPNDDIVATGGSAKVGNLDVRFQANGDVQIYGTITGSNLVTGAVNYSGLLFNVLAANVSGATTFSGAPGIYNTTLKGLALSNAGFAALVNVFGLDPNGLGYTSLNAATANFGVLSSSIVVRAVPEPSAYAMMGFGLLSLGIMARRRAK